MKSFKALQSDTTGFILDTLTAGTEKDRLARSRERSKTPDIVSSSIKWSREGSSIRNNKDVSKKVNFSSGFSQPAAKPVVYQSKAKSKPGAPYKDTESKSTGGTHELLTDDALTTNGKRRKSGVTPPDRLRVPTSSRNRSLSVPPDPGERYSISTIVKARSLAMKWRGKNARMGRRHTVTVLPTITDDSTKISLCANVKCSPQFEAVIKFLENDEDVADTSSSFNLLKIK